MELMIKQFIEIPNNKEKICFFNENIEALKDWQIVIFSKENKRNIFPNYLKTGRVSDNYYNYSPYPDKDFLVYNIKSVKAFDNNENYDYTINGAIELDTNILSYLSSFVENRNPEFKEIFDYIVDPLHNSSISAYLNENMRFFNRNIYQLDSKESKIFKKIYTYEIIKNLDYELYKKSGNIETYIDQDALITETNVTINTIKESKSFLEINNMYEYDKIYCELLLMILINFLFPKLSIVSKLDIFILKCIEILNYKPLREIIIAKHYFVNDLEFFDPIQRKNSKSFRKLNSMAWDLFHIHFMERAVLFSKISDVDIYLPSFLTRDKKLFQMLRKDYTLCAYAYNLTNGQYIPCCNCEKIFYLDKKYIPTKKEKNNHNKLVRKYENITIDPLSRIINYKIVKHNLENEVKKILDIK